MASDAQINANRRNALLSTGPKSPRGRARSAQNSRRHGFRSEREQLRVRKASRMSRDICAGPGALALNPTPRSFC